MESKLPSGNQGNQAVKASLSFTSTKLPLPFLPTLAAVVYNLRPLLDSFALFSCRISVLSRHTDVNWTQRSKRTTSFAPQPSL